MNQYRRRHKIESLFQHTTVVLVSECCRIVVATQRYTIKFVNCNGGPDLEVFNPGVRESRLANNPMD